MIGSALPQLAYARDGPYAARGKRRHCASLGSRKRTRRPRGGGGSCWYLELERGPNLLALRDAGHALTVTLGQVAGVPLDGAVAIQPGPVVAPGELAGLRHGRSEEHT